jgi:putative membrane protein
MSTPAEHPRDEVSSAGTPGETRSADTPEETPSTHAPGEASSTSADLAPRRTLLAAERTYLAWLRTSLGALGIALAVGRLLPAIVGSSDTAFTLLGAGYGAFGLLVLVFAAHRSRRVNAAIRADAPLPAQEWMLWALSGIGAVLGVLTILLVILEP